MGFNREPKLTSRIRQRSRDITQNLDLERVARCAYTYLTLYHQHEMLHDPRSFSSQFQMRESGIRQVFIIPHLHFLSIYYAFSFFYSIVSPKINVQRKKKKKNEQQKVIYTTPSLDIAS